MWAELPEAERRYLLRGIVTAMAVVGAWVVFWVSPISPAALDRTAARAASGDAEGAVEAYLEQAESYGRVASRAESLWRAAVITHVTLDQPERAAELLETLIERYPDHKRVVDAHARMGLIHRHHNGDPIRAGLRWVAAASVNPAHPEAGRWMLDAGLAFADAGDVEHALTALQVAASRPQHAVAAWLAQGRLQLQSDPAQAYSDYDAAFRAGAGGEARRLAHLGMATALEHLDRREAALAELDEVVEDGEADAALKRRRNRLRARRVQ
jgi:tetratricopeptide (TPR) repeat protein